MKERLSFDTKPVRHSWQRQILSDRDISLSIARRWKCVNCGCKRTWYIRSNNFNYELNLILSLTAPPCVPLNTV